MEKVKKYLENFWYYNKWKVVAGIIIVISVALCISQCASRENGDYTFVLFTYNEFADEQLKDMADYLEQYGEDLNGDGEVKVTFNNCSYDKANVTYKIKESRVAKLQATIIADSNQLIFITDKESFEFLDSLYEDVELFENLSLPENEGKSFLLRDDFYEKTRNENVVLPKGYRLSVRTTEGIEKVGAEGELPENLNNCIEFMEKCASQKLKYQK